MGFYNGASHIHSHIYIVEYTYTHIQKGACLVSSLSFLHLCFLLSPLDSIIALNEHNLSSMQSIQKTGSIATAKSVRSNPQMHSMKIAVASNKSSENKNKMKWLQEKEKVHRIFFYRLKGQSLYSKWPLIQLIQAILSFGSVVRWPKPSKTTTTMNEFI